MKRRLSEISAINPKILRAARTMSALLKKRGVRHALIGGLAVGAKGYPRATADADFLVAREYTEEVAGDLLGGEVEGKTVRVLGVDIDLLFPKAYEDFLDAAISASSPVRGVPTIPTEALVYLKLVAARARDNGDVVELLKRGKIDIKKTTSYLRRHRPDLVEDFEALVLQAEQEPR